MKINSIYNYDAKIHFISIIKMRQKSKQKRLCSCVNILLRPNIQNFRKGFYRKNF